MFQGALSRVRLFAARAYHALYRAILPVRFRVADLQARRLRSDMPLPPAKLRFRVGETTSPSDFLKTGEVSAGNIEAILAAVGRSLPQFHDVLDFGCGSARTLMWLRQRHASPRWHGTDVDAEAIEWCREHLPWGSFGVNGPLPPLRYQDGSFDLIYGISVFTHLSEEYQRAWLPELSRVLAPEGLLILSFYNESVWRSLGLAGEVEKSGFLFMTSAKLKGVQPEWYHTAFQTPSRMRELVSGHFALVKIIPSGFGSHDVIVAQRK